MWPNWTYTRPNIASSLITTPLDEYTGFGIVYYLYIQFWFGISFVTLECVGNIHRTKTYTLSCWSPHARSNDKKKRTRSTSTTHRERCSHSQIIETEIYFWAPFPGVLDYEILLAAIQITDTDRYVVDVRKPTLSVPVFSSSSPDPTLSLSPPSPHQNQQIHTTLYWQRSFNWMWDVVAMW